MSFSNKASPPSYGDNVNMTSDTKSLINDALAVERGLSNAKNLVKKVDVILGGDLEMKALQCQDQYFDVLRLSRNSSVMVRAKIEEFVNDTAPLTKMSESDAPFKDLLEAVVENADQLSKVANKDTPEIDARFAKLKSSIDQLTASLEASSKSLETDADLPLKQLTTDIVQLEAKLKEAEDKSGLQRAVEAGKQLTGTKVKPTTSAATSTTNPKLDLVKKLHGSWLIIENYVNNESEITDNKKEHKAKLVQLADLKAEVGSKLSQIKESIDAVKGVSEMLKQLEGRLGHFEAAWTMLLKDASELSAYLKKSGAKLSREALGKRVDQEVIKYNEITEALFIYATKVTADK